jgi:hypothetical protein
MSEQAVIDLCWLDQAYLDRDASGGRRMAVCALLDPHRSGGRL